MNRFCTHLAAGDLPRGVALHHSLEAHAGEFELWVLCLDGEIETALRDRALAGVHLLPIAELMSQFPPLARAATDRTAREFRATCTAWLLRHQLSATPASELLTFVDAGVYFFSSVAPLLAEIGDSSVAVAPQRIPGSPPGDLLHGEFGTGWISLRHDASGLAAATSWADQCAEWCFTIVEPRRYAERKYLDAWPFQFAGVCRIAHPGANVAPWNVAGLALTSSPSVPLVNGEPLIFFHFHELHHLGEGLYDPGLHRYGVDPTTPLRELVYRPYLRELARVSLDEDPDIVPPVRRDDPRSGIVLAQLAEQLRVSEQQAADSRAALGLNRDTSRRALTESRDLLARTELFLKDVEADRAAQRVTLLRVKEELKKAYYDLTGNITYIKQLLAETAVANAAKDAQIAGLTAEMDRRSVAAAQVEQADLRDVLQPYSHKIRRLLVAKFHPRLLPEILWLSLLGTAVEVLGSPPEFVTAAHGITGFHPESLLEWLGELDSLFDERAYRQANPDVVTAIAAGTVASGWDHYLRFGQYEGRSVGHPRYSSGLAEFDAVAFDGSDAGSVAPFLAGRLQPHHQLFVSGFIPPTDWLPLEQGRTYLLGHTVYLPCPPAEWLGPLQPTNNRIRPAAAPTPGEIYPEEPAQRAAWPRISVITVCPRNIAGLAETLHSVLDQNYPNLEYIVIGGNDPGAANVIAPFAPRLVWRTQDSAVSHADGLNRGLSRATGRILSWLDSGDRLAPGSLFTVGQTFLLHGVDVVAGRSAIDFGGDTGTPHIHRNHLPLDRIQPLSTDSLLDLDRGWLLRRFFQQPEVFFTREIFERAGGNIRDDLPASLDYDLWIRLAKAGARLFAVPEILAIAQARPDPVKNPPLLAELRAVSAAHQT